ncbi:MAG TPA: preprotein translocase subunit SecY, partial [Gemmatimonadaceae bacterium]|nr:preprotein translocase subunit SecY [Gemmatimonadaceae bacterium]
MAENNPAAAIAGIFKTPELKSKIGFTLLALFIYRIGGHITAPGVDVQSLIAWFQTSQTGGLLGLYDLFVGGGLSRATVFALGIVPYISSSIVFQILGAVVPKIEKMQREEEGRKQVTQWTRYLTLAIAMVQAWGYALFTETIPAAVANPGFAFKLQMVLFLTTGAMFVMWLGEQITERGIGNGASLLIFFSIVERIWPSIGQTFGFLNAGSITIFKLFLLLVVMVAVVGFTVAITVAARRVTIQIPQRSMGRGRQREASMNFIPLRLNAANVMPIIFAQTVVVVPGLLAQAFKWPWLQSLVEYLQPGQPMYFLLSGVLILFFTYFYTAIIFNPVDIAENLKKQGAFIAGVKPGLKTAEYIERIVTRITLPGAIFLT